MHNKATDLSPNTPNLVAVLDNVMEVFLAAGGTLHEAREAFFQITVEILAVESKLDDFDPVTVVNFRGSQEEGDRATEVLLAMLSMHGDEEN